MALRKCKECGKEVSSKADACPNCGAKVKQHIGCLKSFVLIFFVFLFIGYLASKDNHSSSRQASTATSSYTRPDPKKSIMPLLVLHYNWSKKGFGDIMYANFVIKNMSESDIKDVEITCNHYAKSKTKIDSNTRTIYDTFKKHSKKSINDFNMGFIHSQAETSSCEITDFTIY